MKAISPVRSVRSCYEAVCCLSDQSLAIARGTAGGGSTSPGGGGGGTTTSSSSSHKGPEVEPLSLLYDMNDCYSKLRELVPGIPQGTKVSQVEILQHVIDYIFDLQIVLEEQADNTKGGQGPTAAAEATLFSFKAAELASELCSKDERTQCH